MRTGFRNRREAGQQLADRLAAEDLDPPLVVLGLPRGGVPIAAIVAERLGAPLDVLVVRKLGCPWQPELGFGAIGEGGIRMLNLPLVAELGLTPQDVDRVVAREQAELERRLDAYRAGSPEVDVSGRTAIVIDDGVATGFTARAALRQVRERGAVRVVLAVPVAAARALEELSDVADDVVCLLTPTGLGSIGQYYADFTQTTDAEVTAALADARRGHTDG